VPPAMLFIRNQVTILTLTGDSRLCLHSPAFESGMMFGIDVLRLLPVMG